VESGSRTGRRDCAQRISWGLPKRKVTPEMPAKRAFWRMLALSQTQTRGNHYVIGAAQVPAVLSRSTGDSLLGEMPRRRVVMADQEKPLRPPEQIAAEIRCEQDSTKLAQLADELTL
jgi:hypothetical protein